MGQQPSTFESQLDSFVKGLTQSEKIDEHLQHTRLLLDYMRGLDQVNHGPASTNTSFQSSASSKSVTSSNTSFESGISVEIQSPVSKPTPTPIKVPALHTHVLSHVLLTSPDFPQSLFNQAFFQLINRRFGWSEEALPDEAFHARALMKKNINTLCEQLLEWIINQPLNKTIALAFEHACKVATNPVVRSQTYEHFFKWVQSNLVSSSNCLRELETKSDYKLIQNIMVFGLTDVWSAIRKACSSHMYNIVHLLSFDQLEDLTIILHHMADEDKEEYTWQAKEGSLLGLLNIIRRFHWVVKEKMPIQMESLKVNRTENGLRETLDMKHMKFGDKLVNGLPEFISSPLHPLLFKMLSHQQLSIREYAIKTFSSLLYRSSPEIALLIFRETTVRLLSPCFASEDSINKIFELDSIQNFSIGDENGTVVPSLTSNLDVSPDWLKYYSNPLIFYSDIWKNMIKIDFLNAYESEGLLGLCSFLTKHTRSFFKIFGWPVYFFTFSHYLSHPASTVRQQSSVLFKYIVSRHCDTVSVPFFVLRSLASQWEFSEELQLPEKSSHVSSYDPTEGVSAQTDPLKSKWEWKEGRLLAYELILDYLVQSQHQPTNEPTSPRTAPSTPASYISHQRVTDADVKTPTSMVSTPTHHSKPNTPSNAVTNHSTVGLRKSTSDEPLFSENETPTRRLSMQFSNLHVIKTVRTYYVNPETMYSIETETIQSSLLWNILKQVANSDTAPQFELKRMAEQVIHSLTEVAFWIQPSAIIHMWKVGLTELPMYLKTSCRSIKACITVIAGVERAMIMQHTTTDKRHVERMRGCVLTFIPTARILIQPAVKPSILECMDLLFRFYDQLGSYATEADRDGSFHAILGYWNYLFSRGHPTLKVPNYADFCEVLSDSSVDVIQSKALQAERIMVNRISSSLSGCLHAFSAEQNMLLLPFVVHYARIYEDSEACHQLLASIQTSLKICSSACNSPVASDSKYGSLLLFSCDLMVEKLIPMITNKGLELSILRTVLEIFEAVLLLVQDMRHFPAVCHAIVERMKQENIVDSIPHKLNAQLLQMMSNDISHTSTPTENENEENHGSDCESEKGDSGWDSWDDEPEANTSDQIVHEFGLFYTVLKQNSASERPSVFSDINKIDFASKLRTIVPSDAKVVIWIMEKNREGNIK